MSYVLEALKKAQAQREQGVLPGIHSLQVPYLGGPGQAHANRKPVLWLVAVLLMVVVLLAWRMSADTAGLSDMKPAAVVKAGLVEPTPPAAPAPAATVVPTPVFVLEPVSAAVPTGEVQVPASTSAERTGPKQKTRATGNETPKQAAKAARVYAVTELPDGVRRELPTLVISGGTYSSNPTQRLIIVNNQVFTEGSQAVPGVVVERIEPSTAVLRFRGYAYRVGY